MATGAVGSRRGADGAGDGAAVATAVTMTAALLTASLVMPSEAIQFTSAPGALAARFGYATETHRVLTTDGYVLALVHMHGRTSSQIHAPPVLLWPGMFGSSDVFMILGPKNGAAFLLADAGFDVWVANYRGNVYSRKNIYRTTNSSSFWDFSWHEIGMYDMPAVIDYVLSITGYHQLFFAGHSMGNTGYFVMVSSKPEYNSKILMSFALAPVVFVSAGQTVSIIERMVNMTSRALENVNKLNHYEIPGPGFITRFCPQRRRLCSFMYPLAIGSTYASREAQNLVLENLPAGGSLKQIQHYLEVWLTGQFRPMEKGGRVPPPYPLHKISAPLYLFRAKNDWSFSARDLRRLKYSMSFTPREYVVPLDRFQHNDFIFAPQAGQLVYMKMAEIMASIAVRK